MYFYLVVIVQKMFTLLSLLVIYTSILQSLLSFPFSVDEPDALMMRWPSLHDFSDFDLDSWPAWPVASFDAFRDPLLRWHRAAPFAHTWLDHRPRCRDARKTPDKGEARLDRLKKMRERYQEMIAAEEHRRDVEKKKDAEKQRNDVEEKKKPKAVEIRLEGFRPSDIDVRLVGTTQLRVTAHKVSAAGVEVHQRLLMLPEGLRDAGLKARFDGHVLTVGKRTEEVQHALEGAKQDPSLSAKDNASIQNSEDIKIHDVEDSESFRATQVPIEGTDHLEIPVQNSEPSTSGHSQAKAERKERKSVKRRTEHLDDATIRDED